MISIESDATAPLEKQLQEEAALVMDDLQTRPVSLHALQLRLRRRRMIKGGGMLACMFFAVCIGYRNGQMKPSAIQTDFNLKSAEVVRNDGSVFEAANASVNRQGPTFAVGHAPRFPAEQSAVPFRVRATWTVPVPLVSHGPNGEEVHAGWGWQEISAPVDPRTLHEVERAAVYRVLYDVAAPQTSQL